MPSIRPNILWITTHDISPHLGCYAGAWPGAEDAITPNLDRLAAGGARYDAALATTPVCGPSRAAMITGMFPTAIGTMHMRAKALPPPAVRLLPEYLRAAGYYCSNSGSTDFQVETPVTAFDDCGPQAHWRNRPDREQPFCAAFHGSMTHESQIYDDGAFAGRTGRLAAGQRHDPARVQVPPYHPDTPVFRRAIARYHDLITAMDVWVGDILAELEADGLAEHTLVIFCSDHGRGMPREKRWPYEGGLRVPLIIRWPGKIAAGSVVTAPVTTLDLAATMLAAAGVALPDHMQARPLFDAEGVPADPREYIFGHRDRMDEVEDTVRSVRDRRFHYLRNYHPDRPYMQYQRYAEPFATSDELRRLSFEEGRQRAQGFAPSILTPAQRRFLAGGKPAEELYDLRVDPHELHNLAADPAYAGELRRLRGALEAWQQEIPDLGMIPEAELLRGWRRDNQFAVTARPEIDIKHGRITARCATAGALIGWTADPPGAPAEPGLGARVTGEPQTGGRRWQLYTDPFAPPPGARLWFRAQRLGFLASEDMAVLC